MTHEDDHLNSLVCPDCSAVPCRCSRVTVALEHLYGVVERLLHARYRKRQRELSRRSR